MHFKEYLRFILIRISTYILHIHLINIKKLKECNFIHSCGMNLINTDYFEKMAFLYVTLNILFSFKICTVSFLKRCVLK